MCALIANRLNLAPALHSVDPAPLSLCGLPNFDLRDTASFCPVERNALKAFYIASKGAEWTDSNLWLNETGSFCRWYNVTCDDSNTTVIELKLRNNGLSGKLSPSIGVLSSLVHLDLSDNDMKVCILMGVLCAGIYLASAHKNPPHMTFHCKYITAHRIPFHKSLQCSQISVICV